MNELEYIHRYPWQMFINAIGYFQPLHWKILTIQSLSKLSVVPSGFQIFQISKIYSKFTISLLWLLILVFACNILVAPWFQCFWTVCFSEFCTWFFTSQFLIIFKNIRSNNTIICNVICLFATEWSLCGGLEKEGYIWLYVFWELIWSRWVFEDW